MIESVSFAGVLQNIQQVKRIHQSQLKLVLSFVMAGVGYRYATCFRVLLWRYRYPLYSIHGR